MRSIAQTTAAALRKVFADRRGLLAFVLAEAAILALFVLVPVWTTPGNDVLFQLSILEPEVLAVMVALATLNALVIAMQLHIHRERKGKTQVGAGAGALAASFLATIGCAACYSSLLAVFGLGGSIFIVEHRLWFASAAVAIALFAIAKSARRIEDGCEKACKI